MDLPKKIVTARDIALKILKKYKALDHHFLFLK